MIKTWFCPTMSGFLHMGGLYNAWLNYTYAKMHRGEFGVRIDGQLTTDVRLEYADSIIEDLKVFGIVPDFVLKQHERIDLYREAIEKLLSRDDVYFCDCSEEDMVKRMDEGKWPIPCRAIIRPYKHEFFQHHKAWYKYRCSKTSHYDDFCRDRELKLNLDDIKTVVRLKCEFPLDVVLWMEKTAELGFTSSFDNKELGITHSIDGIDLLSFSWLENETGQLIDYIPEHIFHGVIVDDEGYKLSKHEEAKRVIEYGVDPQKLLRAFNILGKLGDTKPIKESLILEKARAL